MSWGGGAGGGLSWEGGVGKIGEVVSKKGVSLIFILTNPFQCYLSLIV